MNSVHFSTRARILLRLSVKLNLGTNLIFYGNKKTKYQKKKTIKFQTKYTYEKNSRCLENKVFEKILSLCFISTNNLFMYNIWNILKENMRKKT